MPICAKASFFMNPSLKFYLFGWLDVGLAIRPTREPRAATFLFEKMAFLRYLVILFGKCRCRN